MKRFLLAALLAVPASLASAASFDLTQMNVQPTASYKLGGTDNKVYIVETYFNACPFCNDNAPSVNELNLEFADTPSIALVALSRDTRPADFRSWISRHQPNHPVLKDGDRSSGAQFLDSYRVDGFPTTFILDCNLEVLYRDVGRWDRTAYETIKAKALAATERTCRAR